MPWKGEGVDDRHVRFEMMRITKRRGVWQKAGSWNIVSHCSNVLVSLSGTEGNIPDLMGVCLQPFIEKDLANLFVPLD